MHISNSSLLTLVGTKARKARIAKGLTRKALSKLSGVSERYLAQFESGAGNISLLRFAAIAAALETTPASLLDGYKLGQVETSPSVVGLLGARGTGKSSVGKAVAKITGYEFIEVDRKIEEAAGLTLGEIFELHGESYYRRLERQVLEEQKNGKSLVLATGGSIVTHAENFAFLREFATTVWLKAIPEDHWQRVISQGDKRPMAENPKAFEELRSLLASRAPLYAQAEHLFNTSEMTLKEVIKSVADLIKRNQKVFEAPAR